MNIFEKIKSFIKSYFGRHKNIKLIEIKQEENVVNNLEKEEFINSLKVNIKKKKNIETLICAGDGLGFDE